MSDRSPLSRAALASLAPTFPVAAASAAPAGGGDPRVLVYAAASQHHLMLLGALDLWPSGTTLATAANFQTLLAAGGWDAVAVECRGAVFGL